MTQDLYTLQQKTIEWARDKGILEYGTTLGQIKLLSTEVVELYDAIVLGCEYDKKSELGDILVVCTIVAAMQGFTLSEAFNTAYNKIKDRKGKLNKDGVFVKE